MLSNLAVSILDKEQVVTTVAKAKEVRGRVERLITYGKGGTLHDIRLAARTVKDKAILDKLFKDIAPSYKEREGGYVRVLHMGERHGDNAEMAMIQLVGRSGEEKPKKKKKKAAAPKPSSSTPPVAAKTEEASGEKNAEEPVTEHTAQETQGEAKVSEKSETAETAQETSETKEAEKAEAAEGKKAESPKEKPEKPEDEKK